MSPRTDAPAWRWGNIPIPEAHVVGLGTGILLDVIMPWSLPWPSWVGHGCGWPLILAGLWLGAWAVRLPASTLNGRGHGDHALSACVRRACSAVCVRVWTTSSGSSPLPEARRS
jgi:hypothetical protein